MRGSRASGGTSSCDACASEARNEVTDGCRGVRYFWKYKEDERKQKRAEKGLPSDAEDGEDEEEDEEANWAAWNVDDDEDSDDSGGWINVQSDDDINLSDSDDDNDKEKPPTKKAKQTGGEENTENKDNENKDNETAEQKFSKLATTRILTPADLAKLAELRTEAAINAHLPTKARRATQNPNNSARHADDPLTATEIEGLNALSAGKATREEKTAHAKEGKPDRSEFKSSAAKRQERKVAEGKSTTNREKARKKNFIMTLGKAKSKNKRSLVDTRKILKAHHERQKRGGRRGNNG